MASLIRCSEKCRSHTSLNPNPSDFIRVYIQVPDSFMRFGVNMPPNSNFGDLRSSIFDITSLYPREYKLFFRGLEKKDVEDLQEAGVVNNSEVELLTYGDLANPEICKIIGVSIPGHEPATIYVQVSHSLIQFGVDMLPNSNFRDLKSTISSAINLRPVEYRLFFGGVEKGNGEYLQEAGVVNNSEVLLVEYTDSEEETFSSEEEDEGSVDSDVAEVRSEVDKLVEKVPVLKDIVQSGNKVDEKEISHLTWMLMRLLHELEDNIYVKGKARVQKKREVCRVQEFVNKIDDLRVVHSRVVHSLQCSAHFSQPTVLSQQCLSSLQPQPNTPSE